MVTLWQELNERVKENILSEKWFIWEYINDEGNYVKCKYRKVEAFHFYLRFLQEHFNPCPECQKKLMEIKNKSRMILGNKTYEPPVEFTYQYEIDDNSWTTLEEHPASDEEKKQFKDGITTEVTKTD